MVERKQGPWLLTDHTELIAWFQPPLRMKPTGWITFSHNPDNTMVFGVSSKIIKCNLFILSLPNSCLLFLLFKKRFFLELTGLNLMILLPLLPELSGSRQASLCTDPNSCLLTYHPPLMWKKMTVSGDFLLLLWFGVEDRTEFQPVCLYLSLWGSSNVYLFTSDETTSQM